MEPPWDGGTRVLLKRSWSHDQELIDLYQWNLVYSIGHSSTTTFAIWWLCIDLWTFYRKVNFSSLHICIGKGLNVNYSETEEVYGIKVGIYSKINEYLEIYMYQWFRSFFDLSPRSLRFHLFQTAFALKPLDRLQSNYILNLHESKGPKFIKAVEVTWPRGPPCT